MDRLPTPKSEPLQFDLTRGLIRNDLIAFFGSLLCFPIALFIQPWLSMQINPSVLALLPLLLMAMIISFAACSLVDWKGLPSFRAPGLAARTGARLGAITVLIGGGATMLAATFHALGYLVNPDEATSPWFIGLCVTLSALPTIFCASFTAYLFARIRTPRNSPSLALSKDPPVSKSPNRGLLPYFAFFAILSFASPFAVRLIPEPSKLAEIPPLTIPDPAPAVSSSVIIPVPLAPPPPVFAYELPADFENASPSSRLVIERKYLHNVLENRPMAISPDGRLFAYCPSDSDTAGIQVIDLNAFDPAVTFSSIPRPSRMAWSPDSKQLICISDNNPPITILNLAPQRQILLPIPKKDRMPRGQPYWWSNREVAFFNKLTPRSWLDLDSLQVNKMDSSLKWQALPKSNDGNSMKNFPDPILPHSEHFELSVVPRIKSYSNPHFIQPQWTTQSSLYLVLTDPSLSSQRIFPEIDLATGDRIGSATDGSIFIRVRNQTATIYYFGLGAKSPKVISLAKLKLPDLSTKPSSLARYLEEKSLCVFLCAPIINPLTQKVVGPDRNKVKGIARFMSWTDDQAKLWLAEEYSPISEGDILADPHVWIKGKPESVDISLGENWWAVVPSQDDAPDLSAVSTRMLDRKFTPEFHEPFGLPSLSRVTYSEPPNPIKEPPPVLITETASTEKLIQAFIHNHHANASRQDLYAFSNDYSDSADLYTHGIVNRNFIRKDQQDFYQKYRKVTEAIIGDIKIEEAEPRRYEAIYKLDVKLTDQSSKVSNKQVMITMLIDLTTGKPQIIRERNQPLSLSITAIASPPEKTVSSEETIRAFIHAHHASATRRDLNGFINGFNKQVDYSGKGVIDISLIRKFIAQAHRDWEGLDEKVPGNISVSRLGIKTSSNQYRVRYQIHFVLSRKGQRLSGIADKTIDITLTKDGPKIFRTRSIVRKK